MLLKERAETEDGHEMTLQSNHLGHFLLTNLLLNRLKEAPKARIVNVSSIAHDVKWCKNIDFKDLDIKTREYIGWDAYCYTKLLNILFTKELSKRLTDTNVTCYTLHPGVIETEIFRDFFKGDNLFYTMFQILAWPFVKLVMKNAWQGAQTTIYCAVDESLDGISGKYYSDCHESKLKNPVAEDENVAKELWETSSQMVQI